MLVYAASTSTSKEAWETLKSFLEAQGAGIVLAHQKLFQAQCKEGTFIEEHIRTLCGYQGELHSLGQKVDGAEFFSIILLTSLPESWNNYISSIDTTDLKDAPKPVARILKHSCCLGIKSQEDTALAAKSGKKKHPDITCFKCGKKGHYKADC